MSKYVEYFGLLFCTNLTYDILEEDKYFIADIDRNDDTDTEENGVWLYGAGLRLCILLYSTRTCFSSSSYCGNIGELRQALQCCHVDFEKNSIFRNEIARE